MNTKTRLAEVIMIVIMAGGTREVDLEVGNTEIETETGTETMNHTDQIIDEVEIDDRVVVRDGRENRKRGNYTKETGHIVRMIGTV